MTIMKFGDIPQGSHFQEVGGKRKFIKCMNLLPSGLKQKLFRRTENGWEDDFNSVDYQGCAATCPDWVEFKVLKTK